MQVLQRCSHLSSVESSVLFGDAFSRARLESTEELAATAILHTQVKVVF
jgi:hypothetical protein